MTDVTCTLGGNYIYISLLDLSGLTEFLFKPRKAVVFVGLVGGCRGQETVPNPKILILLKLRVNVEHIRLCKELFGVLWKFTLKR